MTVCSPVPEIRVRDLTLVDVRNDAQYVVYWMNAFRRRRYNFALQHARWWAEKLQRPLIVVEALRTGYQWASDRFHRFVIDGMIDNEADFSDSGVTYYPFLETATDKGHGIIETLCQKACLMVTDDYPCFFHPILYDRIVSKWPVAVQLVDSNGLYPMRATDRTFTVAHSFRRHLQKELPKHLHEFPLSDPLAKHKLPEPIDVPSLVAKRWPRAKLADYADGIKNFDRFKIDHGVSPVETKGGAHAALKRLSDFTAGALDRYSDDRNVPDLKGASRLSPYLHFGHIAAHEMFHSVTEHCGWKIDQLAKPNGKREGFWNASQPVESFLDEMITWREIGFNMTHREPDYARFESLPQWARETLNEHANDKREYVYSLAEFESAATHDQLWNAAQNELVREGRIHNYLRMLWGKKILHWTANPRQALEVLIELNNKYALDGRDPNSYSGIFWVLGRYDRAWGPERKIFGKIRYMTSESTLSKFKMKEYLKQYS